jgi:hypothetical protein
MVLATSSAEADLDGDGRSDMVVANRFEGLPRSVRKALEDLGDFLPYRGYRLMDTVLIRTSRRGISAMKGPGGREFTVELRVRSGGPGDETPIVVQGFEVSDMTSIPGSGREVKEPPGATHESQPPPARSKIVIATSFGMEIGETLVVGSSRLNGGDTALVMLVTAMP